MDLTMKRCRTGVVAAVAILAIVAIVSLFHQHLSEVYRKAYSPIRAEYQRSALRALVEGDLPALRHLNTDWERVAALRDFVYRSTTIGTEVSPIPFGPKKYEAWRSGEMPQVCSGMAAIYLALLEAFGYEARLVNMAAAPLIKGTMDTHATVEVFLDGSWVLMDPTFNTHWQVNGRAVSAGELRSAYKTGLPVKASTDGYALLPRRSLDEYYIPYSALLEHIEISRFAPFGREVTRQSVIATLPDEISWRYEVDYGRLRCSAKNNGKVIYSQSFEQELPEDWESPYWASVMPENDRIAVKTDPSNERYQMWSEPFDLPPGVYRITVDGKALSGGLKVGLLDASSKSWVTTNYFHSIQWRSVRTQGQRCVMTADFEIRADSTKGYKIILANWSYEGQSSDWILRGVKLRRLASSHGA